MGDDDPFWGDDNNDGGGGASTWDTIDDSAADVSIAWAGYKTIFTSTLNSAGANLTLTNTTADLTADVSFIDLKLTDDGDANGFFMRGYDNAGNDLKWSGGPDGAFYGYSYETVQSATGGVLDLLEGTAAGTDYIRIKADDDVGTNRKLAISTSVADSEDLTIQLGNNDNTITIASTTGANQINTALAFASTGNISGKIPMISKTGNYTLGTDNAQEAYGYMVWLTGDGAILTLPAVAAGMSVCVYSVDSLDKVVDPNASDGIRNGTTTRNADGHKITSGATDQGSFVCLVADSADGWTVLGKAGTWTDE
jgi:hypothetical protein